MSGVNQIEQLKKRVEALEQYIGAQVFRNTFTALDLAEKHPDMAAVSAGKAIEGILDLIYRKICNEKNYKARDALTLEQLLQEIYKEKAIPRHIKTHISTIRDFRNYGAHVQKGPLDFADVNLLLLALMRIIEWYIDTNAVIMGDDDQKIVDSQGVNNFKSDTVDCRTLEQDNLIINTNRKRTRLWLLAVIAGVTIIGASMVFMYYWIYGLSVPVYSITASSYLPRTEYYSYSPSNINDGNKTTAWVEGVDGTGVNEYINFNFSNKETIFRIGIINGFSDKNAQFGDLYLSNNSLRKAVLMFQDGEEEIILADNKRDMQYIKFEREHQTSFVRLRISDVYAGSKWNDTCISEVKFYKKLKLLD